MSLRFFLKAGVSRFSFFLVATAAPALKCKSLEAENFVTTQVLAATPENNQSEPELSRQALALSSKARNFEFLRKLISISAVKIQRISRQNIFFTLAVSNSFPMLHPLKESFAYKNRPFSCFNKNFTSCFLS